MDFSEFLLRLFFPAYRDLRHTVITISFAITVAVFVIVIILGAIREHRKDKKMKDELNDEEKSENGEWNLWN